MTKPCGAIALGIFGLVFLFVGDKINEPYLIPLRGPGAAALFIASNVVFILLIKRRYWNGEGIAGRILVLLWCLPLLSMLYAHISFEIGKRNVLQTDVVRAHLLGRHFVVGYSSFDEVAPLAEKGLISGGVNQDFAPVLDLRLEASHNRFDFNTLINQRAISGDPATVSDIGLAYIRGLEAFGVAATVKHFPGLGRVRGDTHHFNADLDTPLAVLEATDWRPFREVLAGSRAQLMIGHVTLTAVDPDHPTSHSKRVVSGIIRQKWNYQGVIITDDLVMGAIYSHNICTAVVEALNAGVDVLLVAFDGTQFYRIFACASEAFEQGKLDAAMLRDSEARLGRTIPPDSKTELSICR
jgi:Glycosyl hydrolase family 3 N terminal domain